jgi:lysosomal Pro-X carboxypeptidase
LHRSSLFFLLLLFTQGLLDPWSSGGVTRNLSNSLIAVILPLGAHHLDLMWPDPNDPPDCVAARDVEKAAIKGWIADHAAAMRASRRDDL